LIQKFSQFTPSVGRLVGVAIICVAAITVAGVLRAWAQDDDDTAAIDKMNKDRETACIMAGGCDNRNPQNRPVMVPLYFGAIAFSSTTSNSGQSHGQTTEAAADQTALRNCAGLAKDCRVVIRGSNICLALAVGLNNASGWAPGGTREGAQSAALKRCQSVSKVCVVRATPCTGDDVRFPSPLPFPEAGPTPAGPMDKNLVGTWHLNINPGIWVWRIAANGTFTIYSQAMDAEQSSAGTFTSDGSHWSMHAINNGITDGGAYHFDAQGNFIATGKLGTGTWMRVGR
jgi:hypothetical protein